MIKQPQEDRLESLVPDYTTIMLGLVYMDDVPFSCVSLCHTFKPGRRKHSTSYVRHSWNQILRQKAVV